MSTTEPDDAKLTFAGMTAQVKRYILRALRFPLSWGVPEGDGEPISERPQLFRLDARRLRDRIIRAEHMIRCLIIWRAFRMTRDEGVEPVTSHLPTPPAFPALRESVRPVHPLFAPRGEPLFAPRPPAFRISMPEPRAEDAPCRSGRSAREPQGRWVRPRMDDLVCNDVLYLRLERLDALFDEVDTRAGRLAARWAGYCQPQAAVDPSPSRDENGDDPSSFWPPPAGAPPSSLIRPLKSHDPPHDLLENASEEECEDLHILHDVAFRAAESFPALCG